MMRLNNTFIQGLLLVCTLFVFSASLYFQYVEGQIPCPLCLMQRFCVFLLLLVTFSSIIIRKPSIVRWFLKIQVLIAVAGIYFASRQLWLQSLPPDTIKACVPGLDIMIRYFPWQDIAKALFWGSGECGQIQWQWLNISMAGWSLMYFLAMTILSIYVYVISRSSRVR